MPEILPLCPYGCGSRLKRKDHKTCGSRSCQGKRHRAMKKSRQAGSEQSPYIPEVQDVANAADTHNKRRGQTPQQKAVVEATRDVAREVIRESMTEDVVKSLQGMLLLVPAAIDAIQNDLNNPDPVIHQRAYELVMRYTLGHKSITPPPTEQQSAPMTVIIGVPGSGASLETATAPPPLDPIEGEAEEIRECMECLVSKPDREFVAGSDRCQACHDAVMEKIKTRFGENQSGRA